jgi:hypothetical protein
MRAALAALLVGDLADAESLCPIVDGDEEEALEAWSDSHGIR